MEITEETSADEDQTSLKDRITLFLNIACIAKASIIMELLSSTDITLLHTLAFTATAYCSFSYLQQVWQKPIEPLLPPRIGDAHEVQSAFVSTRNIANALEQAKKQCVVFYGSQTGTAERLAFQFSKAAKTRYGLDCLVADLDDYDCDGILSLPANKAAIFLLATYGEGEATDNAVAFNRHINSLLERKPEASSTLHFAGFGLGNSSYQFYNEMIKRLEKAFLKHAANRLGTTGFGDDSKGTLEEDFLLWKDAVLPLLASRFELKERPCKYQPSFAFTQRNLRHNFNTFLGEPNKKQLRHNSRGPYTLANPYAAPLTVARKLCAGSSRIFLHLEMDLSASTLTYEAGDHLAVRAMNSNREVDRFLSILGLIDARDCEIDILSLDPTIKVPIPSPTTYDSIARYYLDICAPVTRQFLDCVSSFTPYNSPWSRLKALTSSTTMFQERVTARKLNIAQVLEACGDSSSWSNIPFSALLENIPVIKPRYYSISSSPLVSKKVVSITTVVESELLQGNTEEFKGLATNYLLALSSPSQISTHQISGPRQRFASPTCLVSIRRSKFKLTRDPSIPIIMIGPGTGVAPLRGFIESRVQQFKQGHEVGRMMLFYGCRRKDEDYLYEDEWQKHIGIVGPKIFSVHAAFSRESKKPKTYVQHLFREHSNELKRLILDLNAHVFVCGNAHRMARDVFKTMITIIAEHQEFEGNESKAEHYLRNLRSSGRWLEDVW